MRASSAFKEAILACIKECTLVPELKLILKIAIYNTKALWSGSRVAIRNSFFLLV